MPERTFATSQHLQLILAIVILWPLLLFNENWGAAAISAERPNCMTVRSSKLYCSPALIVAATLIRAPPNLSPNFSSNEALGRLFNQMSTSEVD